ncbi:MAG: TIGR00282 family metallophosphoesterase [Clostridia bacterium]|nr:TIGR00282 family metallophosphoesterase [Clostridia bacterium]
MNIFAIGDVVGQEGCEFLRKTLPAFKKLKGIGLTIANGENSAAGNGITPFSAEHLFASGVDLITTGNHVYKRREVYDFLDSRSDIVRPANYFKNNPGRGFTVIDKGSVQIGVINLAGMSYMDSAANPFETVDSILSQLENCRIILVDFHAEATAEKKALGYYLDGRVSAVFGTHTHVQTSDARVLDGGTAYITDLGMTGPEKSVLGIKPEIAITRFKTGMPSRFETAQGKCFMCGCIFEIDEKTGRALSAESVCVE